MPRVSYHQNVFDLLGHQPLVSAAALRQVKECERRCGQPLPASVRDWYSTASVVPLRGYPEEGEDGYLWHEYSNADYTVPLADVLRGFEFVHATGGLGGDVFGSYGVRSPTGQRFVRVLIENQAVVRWWVELNSSDDPPVWVDNESSSPSDWGQVAPSFSAFLFDWFAAYYTRDFTPLSINSYQQRANRVGPPPPKPYLNGLYLRAPREPAILPPHIDYLIDQFEEGPRQERLRGPTTYPFTSPGARLRVTTDGWRLKDGHSAWWLHADSAEALQDLAGRVRHIGALAQTLQAWTKEADPVMKWARQSRS
jgi:hypothetical protein